MLLRRWNVGLDLGRTKEYETFAREVSLPMFRAQKGLIAVIMSRDGASCLVETIWKDESSIRALEASPLYNVTANDIEAMGFLRGQQLVDVRRVHLAYWASDATALTHVEAGVA